MIVELRCAHRDLKAPEDGVGGGPSRRVAVWQDEPARRLADVLNDSNRYPYCERYRYWPGPNSNTYVAWVLRAAGIDCALSWKAFGRNYFTAKQ